MKLDSVERLVRLIMSTMIPLAILTFCGTMIISGRDSNGNYFDLAMLIVGIFMPTPYTVGDSITALQKERRERHQEMNTIRNNV